MTAGGSSPSVFSVADHFAEVDPARFVAALRSTLAALKKLTASVDPAAPSAGLRLTGASRTGCW
ncbi:MAG: hypothetical protein IPF99_43650 [Deltaproteobacteria bacterium]|nr:hypothetical protein [Deltaproteobacteria bacterium]